MPELPEVETVVRDLRPHLVGRQIVALRVSRKALRRPWSPRWKPLVVGQRVEAIERRGKWIVVRLDGDIHLLIHLGMTGQLRVMPATAPREDHTHLVFILDGGEDHLRFRDIRRFGSVTVLADAAAVGGFFEDTRLGPEPWSLLATGWREHLGRTERCLKAALLDQTLVAGVGNIYADESLFEAKLNPTRRGCDLSPAEARRLCLAIPRVLDRAIARRGSSIRNYVGGSGLQGEYQNEFRVYGRTGEPCPRCQAPIARIRLAGRSTHYCPQCQNASTKRCETKR